MRLFRWRAWRYPVGLIVGASLAVLAIFKLGLPMNVSLYTAFIIAAIIWSISSRIPFGIASACFIAIIIVSIMVPDGGGIQSTLREQLAMGIFYSLVVGVILLVREQFGQPEKKHIKPHKQQVDAVQYFDNGGLADIAVPKAPPASEGASGARVNQQRLATQYKPQLAPHPLIHKGPKPNPTQLAGSGRTMDVLRPASHQPRPKVAKDLAQSKGSGGSAMARL